VANEQLWAPWRLAYIQGDAAAMQESLDLELLPGADRECFLCHSVADSADRQRGVVFRGVHCVALLNRYPYNNGHLLVAPRLHLGRLEQLSPEVQLDLSQTIARMVAAMEKAIHPQGFNIGLNLGRAAGAGLPGHLHWHVVPRWNGDTNFMPLLAHVNVIPQALDALWQLLTDTLRSDAGG
jgi:ATP adenylyltransferase